MAKKRQLTPAPDIGDWPVYRWLSEQYGEDKPVRKVLQAKYKATVLEFGQLLREITTKHRSQLRIAFLQLISEPWKVSSKIPGRPNSAELLERIRLKDDSVARFIELGRKVIGLENLLSAETTPEELEERSNKIASLPCRMGNAV